MEWYENPIFTSIIPILGIILTGVVIALMVGYRQKDTQFTKTGRYEEHIKNLFNKLHSDATRNEHDKIGSNYYGLILQSTYSTQILNHLKISEKDGLTDAYSFFNTITENRQEQTTHLKTENEKGEYLKQFFDIKESKEKFDRKIDTLHEKINHDVKPKFGFCQDCVENITTNRFSKWLKKRQLS